MSEGRGVKKGQSTISDVLFYAGSGIAPASTTTNSKNKSRASVNKLAQQIGSAITVADTEYTVGAEESIRGAAGESCDGGDGLERSPIVVLGSPSVMLSREPVVGSSDDDGLVGLPATNAKGITTPIATGSSQRRKKKKKKGQLISPDSGGASSLERDASTHTETQFQQQQKGASISAVAMVVLEKLKTQKQRSIVEEIDEECSLVAVGCEAAGLNTGMDQQQFQQQQELSPKEHHSTDEARILALENLLQNQQHQIEELKSALALAQKNTPYKARLAFEKDIGDRVVKLESAKHVSKADLGVIANKVESLKELVEVSQDRCESIQEDVYGREYDSRRNVNSLNERVSVMELRHIQQWVNENPESHRRILEKARSWGISLTELESDAGELARWILPQYFGDICLLPTDLRERDARYVYVRNSPQLARYPLTLDILWRYRISETILGEAPIKHESIKHIHYLEMIKAHFARVGVTRAVETSQARRPRLPQSVVLTRTQESNDGDR